jgi:predicted DNA-binding protein with PD1-like motif
LPAGLPLEKICATLSNDWRMITMSRPAAFFSAAGSLSAATLRLAGAQTFAKFTGAFEIVSLSGTVSPSGVHLHLAIAGADGKTTGGHLVHGCVVHTTVEIVMADMTGVRFVRLPDAATGYNELNIWSGG